MELNEILQNIDIFLSSTTDDEIEEMKQKAIDRYPIGPTLYDYIVSFAESYTDTILDEHLEKTEFLTSAISKSSESSVGWTSKNSQNYTAVESVSTDFSVTKNNNWAVAA